MEAICRVFGISLRGVLFGAFVLSWYSEEALSQDDTAQEVIDRMREKTDRVSGFSVEVTLALDVDFIRMPEKSARLSYVAPDRVDIDSEDFIVVPKRGLDFSYQQVFENPYTALYMGKESIAERVCDVVKVIPKGRSRLALATLFVDEETAQTVQSEFVTRNDGTYTATMCYDQKDYNLPQKMVIRFQMEKFKLPLRYLGKNTSVDKAKLKEDGMKEGSFILTFSHYEIEDQDGEGTNSSIAEGATIEQIAAASRVFPSLHAKGSPKDEVLAGIVQ